MKILHTVEFYYPSVGGMQEVVKRLSELLVQYGHDVTVATTRLAARRDKTINGVKIKEFEISGNLVRGVTGERAAYEDYLLQADFDVIVNFAAQQWATDLALPLLSRIKSKKVFVPTGFSGLYAPEYRDYFERMKLWMREFDMNVFLSDDYRDVNFARDNGISKRMLIPNGASESEFMQISESGLRQKLGIPDRNFLVLHVGSHTGLKGHAAAIRAFDRAKISSATLMLVAQKSGGCARGCRLRERLFRLSPRRLWDRKQFVMPDLSREDTVAAFKAADVFLFLSNIECSPIVLFESMASRTPFLTSDVGNAKEIVQWSSGGMLVKTRRVSHGYVRADSRDAARRLERLYYDVPLRTQLANSGFEAWMQRFTWEGIVRQYEKLFQSLLSGAVSVSRG